MDTEHAMSHEQSAGEAQRDMAATPLPMQMSMPELLKEIMTPDRPNKEIKELTKDLKVSNIKRNDISEIVEFSDIAMQWRNLGAIAFADHLTAVRNTKLASFSSVQGFERIMGATSILSKDVRFSSDLDKKRSLFSMFRRKK